MRKAMIGLAMLGVFSAAATSFARARSYVECTQIGWTDPSTGEQYPYSICREVYL